MTKENGSNPGEAATYVTFCATSEVIKHNDRPCGAAHAESKGSIPRWVNLLVMYFFCDFPPLSKVFRIIGLQSFPDIIVLLLYCTIIVLY